MQVGPGERGRQDGAIRHPAQEVAATVDRDHLEASGPAAVVAATDLDLRAGSERPLGAGGGLPRVSHQPASMAAGPRPGKTRGGARRPVIRCPLVCRTAALAAVIVLGLALGGCSVLQATYPTSQALDEEGFRSAAFKEGDGDTWVVTVEKDVDDLDAGAADAAGVVWRELPYRVERLEVRCGNGFGGKGAFEAERAELERRFGARDPDLDRGPEGWSASAITAVLIGLVVVGLVVLGGIGLVIVAAARRSRQQRPPPTAGGPAEQEADGEVSQPPPPRYGPPT